MAIHDRRFRRFRIARTESGRIGDHSRRTVALTVTVFQ